MERSPAFREVHSRHAGYSDASDSMVPYLSSYRPRATM
jgi:hypothetical protein